MSLSIVGVVLSKDDNLWDFEDAELFTELLLAMTIDSSDLDDAVQLLTDCFVLVRKRLALFQLGVEEVQNPNLLSAVELENGAQVKLVDIGVLKEIGNDFFLLLLMVSAKAAAKASTTASEVLREDVIEVEVGATATALTATLLVLLNSLFSCLVIDATLFSV